MQTVSKEAATESRQPQPADWPLLETPGNPRTRAAGSSGCSSLSQMRLGCYVPGNNDTASQLFTEMSWVLKIPVFREAPRIESVGSWSLIRSLEISPAAPAPPYPTPHPPPPLSWHISFPRIQWVRKVMEEIDALHVR